MHLGLSVSPFGHHPSAWRLQSKDALGFAEIAALVSMAEQGGFDFAFFADGLGRLPATELSPSSAGFEPTTLVAALATVVRKIGLVAAASTSQHEPYNLARRFASLDLISKGRVGWNLVAASADVSRDEEYVDVVDGLWDSWDADAFVYDKVAGRFFVPEKMHVLNHAGPHFTVRGPLNVNRSPQDRPVMTHVLTPETAMIAARHADVVIIGAATWEEVEQLGRQLTTALQAENRERSSVRILANVLASVAASREDGERDLASLGGRGNKADATMAGLEIVDAPAALAGQMEQWFATDTVDGFLISPLLAEDTRRFAEYVIPELTRRGVLKPSDGGTTLRDRLRLDRPLAERQGRMGASS